jgi:hypothetical protein
MACNHKIICDKANKVCRCENCNEVTGHFETYPTPKIPAGMAEIANGLYARTA